MTKILYLCESLKIGGAEQLILTTLKYLDRNKFYPVVYCIEDRGELADEIKNIGINVNNLNKKLYLWNILIIFDLLRIFNKEKPDILHTHLFYANYFGRIAALFFRIPIVIITEHGTYSNFKRFYHYWIDSFLVLFTDKIIAVSYAVKRYILKHSIIPSSKITVIYNGVDMDRFDSVFNLDKLATKRKFGFIESDIVIGCVSNLAPWKGQFILLQAFVRVAEKIPNVTLCIVGRDANGFKSLLETFTLKNGLSEKVHILGERRDIPQILRSFDIFVFPSLTEGLGISLLEAMYMGLPAIASNTEGITEIIEHQKDGILFRPADIAALSESIFVSINNNRIKNISINAREKIIEKFSPRHYINELQSLYSGQLKEKGLLH